ncbi:hypothetical protein [Singulisphaera sp. PoT]|uniref:hypothetical protein n=1 Tax=Singulisphaera sp. PoT TaxID=3411797 RepID=UPI003BF4BA7B
MSILTAPSRSVRVYSRVVPTKPARRSDRPSRPFGEGLEDRGLCCPIDQRPLPMINGQGLTQSERWRVNGAQNRAMSSYAFDCPEASLSEIENVGRKAATDELRRLLMERPAAPALKLVEVEPAPAPRPASSNPRVTRRVHDRGDELWWAQIRDAEERGLGDEADEEEMESAYHEWLYSAAPVVISDLSDDHNGAFFIGEGVAL